MSRDKGFGVPLIQSGGNASLKSEEALTIVGFIPPEGQSNIFYGAVLNPDITQVLILSEGDQGDRLKGQTLYEYGLKSDKVQ